MKKAPLSPHLQIYKLPLNALLSISHRITGVILSLVFISSIVMLTFLAMGEKSFQIIDPLLNSVFFMLLINSAVLLLIYHFLNGIRHLLMDNLIGLEKTQSYQSSIVTLILTATLFILWLMMQ